MAERAATPIGGQTTNQYTVQAGDVGDAIRCRVTAHNGGGDTIGDSRTPSRRPSRRHRRPATTRRRRYPGARSRATRSPATRAAWSGSPTFTFEWLSEGTPIGGQTTGTQYTLTADDVGNAIRCRVTAHNAGGDTAALSEHGHAERAAARRPRLPATRRLRRCPPARSRATRSRATRAPGPAARRSRSSGCVTAPDHGREAGRRTR